MTKEPQYQPCFDEPEVVLGPMTGATFRWNPARLGWYLARYKFVAKMLKGKRLVAEIGCGDAFASAVVKASVGTLHLYDFDNSWGDHVRLLDIVNYELPIVYNAIFMCDVLEHIRVEDEPKAMEHICAALTSDGVFIAGVPSLESQVYATEIAKAGHVNCRTGDHLKHDLLRYFENVFVFSMNDEVVHTGDFRMAHYLFAVCVGPLRRG